MEAHPLRNLLENAVSNTPPGGQVDGAGAGGRHPGADG
jgi:hypothetical protein